MPESLMLRGSDACFDKSGRFRYALWRQWDRHLPTINFIMLNPSTADASHDDPTIARCRRYAERWGFGTLLVTNLFAYRATNPRQLYAVRDPVGPDNDQYLLNAVHAAHQCIAAWGIHGQLNNRQEEVLKLLAAVPLFQLGKTRNGFPRHPLYLSQTVRPVQFIPTGPGDIVVD
ncbi:MAG: hypothetical protein C7B45_10605 [Sulfobacillus acidophilus]|uniref:DUF1643 domain-containing protein n=1 Tax=Sulfobacillus acidophilus TaxID=53633 RepID=A0A2T2WGV6_9FIRM|nr:MAG: hypothetical protein C7B45_10605 [Sulfobacillus acidophilus]